MKRTLGTNLIAVIAACALATSCTAANESPVVTGKIDFELTGTVLDTTTKQPIEGAYVLAVYTKLIAGPAAVTSWCVKTKGMHTGPDGKFHFPVEKRDGRSPFLVMAIKKGYFGGRTTLPDDDVWAKQSAAAYSGRDLYLSKQNLANPDLHFGTAGDAFCHHAPTREAAAAAVEFIKIELAESIAYGKREQGIRSYGGMIETLQALPSEASAPK